MKPSTLRFVILGLLTCVVLALAMLIASAPKHPIALIYVVDAAGKPVAGAVIRPDGLRTKSGPYASGHYGWMTGSNGVPNDPMVTDASGYARVPYPKYVFERIETGQISFSVNHAEFVPDRPFRIVTAAPPSGAPWRVRADYWWDRIRHRAFVSQTDPVVLRKGAILKLSARGGPAEWKDVRLFAQTSGGWSADTNFWMWPEPGVTVTRRLAAGTQTVRGVRFDAKDWAWFSDVVRVVAVAGQTNEVAVDLQRGVTLRGQLDPSVPRPVTNGRMVARVTPQGEKLQNSPPLWHSWSPIREDGSFEIGSLPPGDLEVVALCNGFVSTNGPGQFQTRYPQKHLLGTNDLAITIGMEPTARLEVHVTDNRGNPVKDARVATWPNVRYGEWGSVILLSDCYNMSDWYLSKDYKKPARWLQSVPDFEGTSDSSGIAVLPNLPITVREFAVEHSHFALPATVTPGGDKRRQASVTLIVGETNQVSVQLEPREKSPIAHY